MRVTNAPKLVSFVLVVLGGVMAVVGLSPVTMFLLGLVDARHWVIFAIGMAVAWFGAFLRWLVSDK